MVHASVFSGIGGPEVAAAMLGWENAFHCDINPFGVAVLNYWFPKSKSYGDVKKQSFKNWGGRIDVLTGGFPCQPFSNAGKRGGANDYRYLWPEMFRVIQEVRPTWFVGENVDGLTTMVEPGTVTEMGCETSLFGEGDGLYRYQSRDTFTIERICRDLESARYSVQPFIIPACAVGAPHRRDRVFIVAYNTDCGDGCTKSGNADSAKGTQGVQERNDLRQFGEPGTVRPEMCETLENALRVGCDCGQESEQGCIRNEWNVGTGDSERICAESRTDSADTNGKGGNARNQHVQSELADGTVPISNGRVRSSSYANGKGLEESQLSGRRENQEEGGAGLHDRVERPHTCDNGRGDFADTVREGLEGMHEPGTKEREEWLHLWGTAAGYDFASDKELLPENRWANFPTVSPVHAGNDGLPFDISDLSISFSKWRNGAIEACGNAIVVQVMYEIFRAIESVTLNQ